MKNDFNSSTEKQGDYVEKVNMKIGLGKVSILRKIDNLLKWGVLTYYKAGDKRRNKIISFS